MCAVRRLLSSIRSSMLAEQRQDLSHIRLNSHRWRCRCFLVSLESSIIRQPEYPVIGYLIS